MFGGNKKMASTGGRQTTLIAKGTEVVGEINFSGSLYIEGLVRGNLVASDAGSGAQVIIQAGGEVVGDIVAPTIVVNSKIAGNIYSSERVELAAGAEVCGDVHYRMIEMVKGSQVNGSLLYSPELVSAMDSAEPATRVQMEKKAGKAPVDKKLEPSVAASANVAKSGANASKANAVEPAAPVDDGAGSTSARLF
ncbi:polymer-forming cytoskeletal protein [Pseudomonadales bacterium]|jgi:cytoskeletal protein CcmA (bactofilin family)|nr:polymer-forming cytoskeletal protein [Pseudomonadales bacterium]MDB4404711.1 polymer-forming cytoskeletal protein [bacterium]MDB4431268.1 polymer-forming cytoskeletal protein [Pseudomonadales bacterium]MDB4453053.1 polymer-forming cytoskeletal protein [bacterium]MDB4631414.1 polymer-forming cytoskeletal protein [Pseudomonadales bacterium]